MLYTEKTETDSADAAQWEAVPVPPVYPPHLVSGFGEGADITRAVVHVRMCLTRNELLVALNQRWAMGPFDIDAATADEIRAEVEFYCAGVGDFEVQNEAEHFWAGYENWTTEEQAVVAALVRAIDRAYPVGATSGIVVDGSPMSPSVRCLHCTWADSGRHIEILVHRGLVHTEWCRNGEGR